MLSHLNIFAKSRDVHGGKLQFGFQCLDQVLHCCTWVVRQMILAEILISKQRSSIRATNYIPSWRVVKGIALFAGKFGNTVVA